MLGSMFCLCLLLLQIVLQVARQPAQTVHQQPAMARAQIWTIMFMMGGWGAFLGARLGEVSEVVLVKVGVLGEDDAPAGCWHSLARGLAVRVLVSFV